MTQTGIDNADIRNYRRGGTRRKVALALVSVAAASMIMASEASAKPAKKQKKAKVDRHTEQVVDYTVPGEPEPDPTDEPGAVDPLSVDPTSIDPTAAGATTQESWGSTEGVRWR